MRSCHGLGEEGGSFRGRLRTALGEPDRFEVMAEDFESYASTLFTKAVASEIAVIGVTDYFSADGYKCLKEIQGDQSRMEALLGEEVAEKTATILLLQTSSCGSATSCRSAARARVSTPCGAHKLESAEEKPLRIGQTPSRRASRGSPMLLGPGPPVSAVATRAEARHLALHC